MQIEDIVSVAEIETPRNPEEFVQWFEQQLGEINSNNDPDLKRQVRCRSSSISKWFYEEAWPIYELLKVKRSEWHGVKIQCVRGNQPYDALLHKEGDYAASAPDMLEVTLAIEGLDNSIRMKELCSYGGGKFNVAYYKVR